MLLSRSVYELDGKDVTEHERKYLVSLISRKKGTNNAVYQNIKDKKENGNNDKISVDGTHVPIHNTKKFATG